MHETKCTLNKLAIYLIKYIILHLTVITSGSFNSAHACSKVLGVVDGVVGITVSVVDLVICCNV